MTLSFAVSMVFVGVLLCLAWQDVRTLRLSAVGLIAALGLAIFLRWPVLPQAFLGSFLLVTLAGSTHTLMTYWLKKPALGSGDLVLFFMAGLWCEPMQIPVFLMLVGGGGALFGWLYTQHTNEAHFPFGAVLVIVLGGWVMLTAR
jgi:prepilin signal peptidase PulO-like enzyme (type II secretory pathway)